MGLAAVEVCLQRIVFGLGGPKAVGGFHPNLHRGVFAAESFVGRLPGGCVAVTFGRVGWPVDSDQLTGSLAKLRRVSSSHCWAPFCHESLRVTTWSSWIALEAVVLGVVQVVSVATKSIDLGGSPTSRKARREHNRNP